MIVRQRHRKCLAGRLNTLGLLPMGIFIKRVNAPWVYCQLESFRKVIDPQHPTNAPCGKLAALAGAESDTELD